MSLKPHHEAIPSEVEVQIQEKTKSWVLKPKALSIIWGNDGRYWKMPTNKEDAAELLQVCWLEVKGKINDPEMKKDKEYEISFELEKKEDAFGWNGCTVFFMAKIGTRGRHIWRPITLSQNNNDTNKRITIEMRIKVEDDKPDNILSFGLYEVWSGRWKGGLLIYQAKVSVKN